MWILWEPTMAGHVGRTIYHGSDKPDQGPKSDYPECNRAGGGATEDQRLQFIVDHYSGETVRVHSVRHRSEAYR